MRATHPETTVTLLDWPADIIGTCWTIWQTSRNNKPLEVIALEATWEEKEKLFTQIVTDAIPVAENFNFTFLLENVSIELREQMVRHRVGLKFGERLGVDIIPELVSSTWWSQSMRILDMSQFSVEGRYHTPASIRDHTNPELEQEWDDFMEHAALLYTRLVERGIPMEDARGVIPLAATHRITWTLNLATIQHIVGKRGCWILQLGIWEPVIRGMIDELAEKVHPVFHDLVQPPCITRDKFTECAFHTDNQRRASGLDKLPPCVLWANKYPSALKAHSAEFVDAIGHTQKVWNLDDSGQLYFRDENSADERRGNARLTKLIESYTNLWQRNAVTGIR